jgi:DNA-binding NtrC family response regulator
VDLYRELRKKKILLVDDDEWIRHSLALLFKSEGCRLKTLENAEAAMAALRKGHYDIIIVDYRLPGIDGLEFFRRIRESQPQSMKIMITAYGNEALVSDSRKLGVQEFIEKPFSSKTIENALSRLLRTRE